MKFRYTHHVCDSGDCFGCRYVSHAGAYGYSSSPSKEEKEAVQKGPLAAALESSSSEADLSKAEHLEFLDELLEEVSKVMHQRGRKYGPGNIAEFGETGVLVRLSDKLSRLRHTKENFDDEGTEDSWLDVVGYGLIGLAWSRGLWPGSEKGPKKTATTKSTLNTRTRTGKCEKYGNNHSVMGMGVCSTCGYSNL
jgi:hypothetical protein